MSYLDYLHNERLKDLETFRKPEWAPMFKHYCDNLYPDKAHFVYELIQNAEDANASYITFLLEDNRVVIEHDGRDFTESNVDAITSFNSEKADEYAKIGKFGIGFKSVFAYTSAPIIYSPSFSFRITETILPHEVEKDPTLERRTRIVITFDNPKKAPHVAKKEIADSLQGLLPISILYLEKVVSINWAVGNDEKWELKRTCIDNNHFRIVKKRNLETIEDAQFLCFFEDIPYLPGRKIAVAYSLRSRESKPGYGTEVEIPTQLAIVPAESGKVSVYFPNVDESSGLRFHIHAPFATPLDRASITNDDGNEILLNRLVRLVIKSLYQMREMGLLTGTSLSVFPNNQDKIENQSRYERFRTAIQEEMKSKNLVPSYSGCHLSATHILRPRNPRFRELFSRKDLSILENSDSENYDWTPRTKQDSRERFFLESICTQIYDEGRLALRLSQLSNTIGKGDEKLLTWLGGKDIEWHRIFYSILAVGWPLEPKSSVPGGTESTIKPISSMRIVLSDDGGYYRGSECFLLPREGISEDENYHFVDNAILQNDGDKERGDKIRDFLSKAGVRELREDIQVEIILRQRYSSKDPNTRPRDLLRFIELLEKDGSKKKIFSTHYILRNERNEWCKPANLYVDSPLLETGLDSYFGCGGGVTEKSRLSSEYLNIDVGLDKILKFAKEIGVTFKPKIERASCKDNPNWNALNSLYGRPTYYGDDYDYTIRNLGCWLSSESISASKLMWGILHNLDKEPHFNLEHDIPTGVVIFKEVGIPPYPPGYLTASYSRNSWSGSNRGLSQLACILKNTPWIPQRNGTFVCPRDADPDLLLTGFDYAPSCDWVEKLEFGKAKKDKLLELERATRNQEIVIQKQKEKIANQENDRNQQAKALGFTSSDEAALAKKLLERIPIEERNKYLEGTKQSKEDEKVGECELQPTGGRRPANPPNEEVEDPKRRTERKKREARDAISRDKGRCKTLPPNHPDLIKLKKEADTYLTQYFCKEEGMMICQICRTELPFKKLDGEYYFETTEFMRELKAHHPENYLALCANHGAMFAWANRSKESMKEEFTKIDKKERILKIRLADQKLNIYFTDKHILDLEAIIESETEEDVESIQAV